MERDVSPLPKAIRRKQVPPDSPHSPWSLSETNSKQQSPLLRPTSPRQDPRSWQRLPSSQIDLLSSNPESDQSSTLTQPRCSLRWYNILKSRWLMIACLLFGIGAAIGHDTLNNHLYGKKAKNQIWWLRLGQSLAFVSKANSAIAVSLAYQQIAWRAVAQRSFSVHAVDSLFGAAHNAIELLNGEAWRKSWFVMILALYMWVSPFVVIFTSATLSVVRHQNTTCYSVRTLNFSKEALEKWNQSQRARGNETLNGSRLSWYNDTLPDDEGPDVFDFWISPSAYLDEIASTVLIGGQAIQRNEVADEICGPEWDCSTTIHFTGPGYRCEQLAKGANSPIKRFNGQVSPLNLSELIPNGWLTYQSIIDEGDYAERQIEHERYFNRKKQKLPFPKNLGAFRTEPIMWLGYVTVDDVLANHANNSDEKGWYEDFTPVISACEHWEVNYTVTLTYTRGFQSYNVTNRDYIRRIINTTYVDDSADDGTLDKTVAEPQENYVFPRDWKNYQRVAAYHSLGFKLRSLLHGRLSLPDGSVGSDITQSKLVGRHELLPVPDFVNETRRLYENLLISLLSDPQLLAVTWAAHPDQSSGTRAWKNGTEYPCTRRSTASYFFYQRNVLVTVYALSFVIVGVAVAYGMKALRHDGVEELREITFSSIASATKDVRLNRNNRKERIRAWLVEDDLGGGVYEFRAAGAKQRRRSMSDALMRC
ncbi:hypothetical protein F53441_785 [Fusarium austroafricanum]|uniref:Uncharacterized protein n=1 Tax=Fusarium austroafricanum TaxID=2364996 RepID=A0A8H4KUY5_9HYPO|nr:hypothetical protein F53441_785 [Fusarium austroafricanum]